MENKKQKKILLPSFYTIIIIFIIFCISLIFFCNNTKTPTCHSLMLTFILFMGRMKYKTTEKKEELRERKIKYLKCKSKVLRSAERVEDEKEVG